MKSSNIKICNSCHRVLSEDDFRTHRSECKRCARNNIKLWRESNKEHLQEYYQKNKEHIIQYYKQRKEDDPEYRKQYRKQYYIDNKKHCQEYSKQYLQDNKEHIREYQKQYRKDNKERLSKRDKQYYVNNKEHYQKLNKQYAKDNKDKRNTLHAKRRAMKLNQTPILTESEKQKILFYYNISECMGKDWHVDHIKPISKGGTNHPDNLQVIPAHHNMCKGNNEDYIIPNELIIKI